MPNVTIVRRMFPALAWRTGAVALATCLLPVVGRAQARCEDIVQRLPVIERPATSDTNPTLVVLLTGDGGWAGADEKVAAGLLVRGAAVVGLNMRSYLRERKTPDQVANDVGCLADVYGARWRRPQLMLLGYSRGADIAPFVVTRWPERLTDRLNMVALVSLATRANFQFHLVDLVRDVHRDDDLPVGPELQRLWGQRVTCVYGLEEAESGCRGADASVVRAYGRPGGHRLTGGFDAIADLLSDGLRARK